jgi:hypothetical protein
MIRHPLLAALLFVSACSPGAEPPAQEEARLGPADPRTFPPPEAAKVEAKALPVSEARSPADPAAGARRCGWLVNPTPGNWWLIDSQDQWILATQGSEPAPGMEDLPDMSTAGWVETNGHYGHGCACMTIAHDPATGRVTRVADARPKPLKQCQADRRLPQP